MLEAALSVRIVITTVVSEEEGARMGRTLVEERLAACATIISGAQSIYRWQGQIDSSAETILLLKTESDRLAALDSRLHELHSYQTPELLVLTVDSGSHDYLAWLHASLHEST
ncbi:MAG: divalent-cation tolerance protein CutA [Terracidiphilus sp.]|jgi:periplasmic divalent cation tolerance protein